MKKIYEATGQKKRDLIEVNNDLRAFDQYKEQKYNDSIGISNMVMVASIKEFPFNSIVETNWCLNGLIMNNDNKEDIIVIEPFKEQIRNESLENISEINTYFNAPIKLSKKSILLMSIDKYEELSKDAKIKKQLNKMNLRLYEGEKDLALEMLLYDKNYIFIEMTEKGYLYDENNHFDKIEYIKILTQKQKEIVEQMKEAGRNVTYKAKNNYINKNNNNKENIINIEKELEENGIDKIDISLKESNYKMISGLTDTIEGNINLDEDLYATTDIGKIRENQEDAVFLIKDKENPKFKMMAVADGMGGWSKGEVASDIIIKQLKEWFENLSLEEKNMYYTGIAGLKDSIKEKISHDIQVESATWKLGGSTLVCAIVGEKETLIANIGDSRAYITKNGKIEQISREDTVAEENLKKGKTPSKEASRFDRDSNQLTQCIGMDRRDLHYPNIEIIDNKDYDMILLFSDGVTDCLSDEDIAVVCKNTNKKELTNKIVEKAIRHDSIQPDELIDYIHLNSYIQGGKDNTTAAVYIPKDKEEFEIGE